MPRQDTGRVIRPMTHTQKRGIEKGTKVLVDGSYECATLCEPFFDPKDGAYYVRVNDVPELVCNLNRIEVLDD